jgi:hypothetical protein
MTLTTSRRGASLTQFEVAFLLLNRSADQRSTRPGASRRRNDSVIENGIIQGQKKTA